MGLRASAAAFLLCGTSVVFAADGQALLVDDFESGGTSLAAGCPPPPGSSGQNVETGLTGVLGGRRSTFLMDIGPLVAIGFSLCPSEPGEHTFVSAELTTGAGDDGMLFEVTNNITDTSDVGAYFELTYQMPDFTAFDLTDGGASDTLQIAFDEVGGPFVLRISAGYRFGAQGYGRFDFDSPGILSIPFESLFHETLLEARPACPNSCPDLSRLEFLAFNLFAPSGALEQRIRISDIRSVPEPATAALLFGGLAAIGFIRRAPLARRCR